MRFNIRNDARPQARLLLIVAALSIALWFIPFAELLTYPFRIFVTFIHEGGHALAAIFTGNSVASMTVAMDGSGETYTTHGGLISQFLISSAGYVGAMLFGALLLTLIRKAVTARIVLIGSAILVAGLTVVFGLINPLFAGSWSMLGGAPFTIIAGTVLSVALFAVARFASARVATFVVSFLAIQCVLNALSDLKTVFFLSTPFTTSVPTDAINMANATGIPAIFWAIAWIGAGFVILAFAMRMYVVARDSKSSQPDLPFDSPLDV